MRHYNSDGFYEELYTAEYEDTQEERIEAALRDKNISHYRMKTIKSGEMLECEIYPVWTTHRSSQRARKEKASRAAQRNLNDKNAKKKLVRLINANFTEQDIWLTVTYDKNHLPASPEEAKRNMQNYIRRLAHAQKKNGGAPLKFIYVTEYEDGRKRIHHHAIINFTDRDMAEKLWQGGARTQARRLQPDEFGLTGLAQYITKDPKGNKRYVCSKNLAKPLVTIAEKKMTRSRARKIAENENAAPEIFTKIYKGYSFTDIKTFYSEYASGAYIYVRMRKAPSKTTKGGKRNE